MKNGVDVNEPDVDWYEIEDSMETKIIKLNEKIEKLESRILNLEVKAGIRMPKYRPLESGSPYDLNKCNFAGGKRRRNEKYEK